MKNKKVQQLHELPLELRAYINQQISSLAPFCLPDSRAAVLVLKEINDDNDKEEFTVTISLSGGDTEVKSTSRADNIIDATKRACQTLLEHLNKVHREMLDEMEERQRLAADEDADLDDDSNDGSDSGGMAVCH
ncbi:MAG: hypothetical protein KDD58_15475 [Bdellovibrionales bacterium]|nr:hypothetical protein [Bdellovibrionales bacterium]